MSKLKTFINLCKNGNGISHAFMENFSRTKFSHCISDAIYLKIQYYCVFNRKLNLKNPTTFNEKLQWLKLYDRNPKYTSMVDKKLAKIYVADLIGNKYIIPTLDDWSTFDNIDFGKLPNQFVLKTNHDSGCVIICKDKQSFDFEAAKNKIDRSLSRNFYYYAREWPYKDVKPSIIAEKYMIDDEVDELRDYKFFCFGGKCYYFKVDFNRFINHRANYFDRQGNLIDLGEVVCPPDFTKKIELPKNLDLMIQLSETISKDIPFLRVDFYEVNGNVYFGEMTFFPAGGLGAFTDDKWDKILGELLCLPQRR